MRYKGVIFDLDGVICSTDEYHYLAWKALADQLKIPFDRKMNNQLRGVSRLASLELILKNSDQEYNNAEKAELAEKKNSMYKNFLARMSAEDLPDDVKQTLSALRKAGIKLAVGSSSKNTPYILNQIGLNGFFDAVADGNCITHSKPHPEVFLKAASMLDLPQEQCLVIEDAHSGVEAAVTGGFDCAALGDARDDTRARWHLNKLSDCLNCI